MSASNVVDRRFLILCIAPLITKNLARPASISLALPSIRDGDHGPFPPPGPSIFMLIIIPRPTDILDLTEYLAPQALGY